MLINRPSVAALCVAVLMGSAASTAHSAESASTAERAALHATPPPDMAEVMTLLEQIPPGLRRTPHSATEMPIFVHQILSSDQQRGHFTAAQLQAQMDRMNAAFAPMDLQFRVAGWDAVAYDPWFLACTSSDSAHPDVLAMTDFFVGHPDGANGNAAGFVHLYTCGNDATLGFSSYPWDFHPSFGGLGEQDRRHRLTVHYATLPGGSYPPYNEGGTLVHEMGHFVGLIHTFEGDDCQNGDYPIGDWSIDTPAMTSGPTAAAPSRAIPVRPIRGPIRSATTCRIRRTVA